MRWAEYCRWRKKAEVGLAAHDIGVLSEDLLRGPCDDHHNPRQRHDANDRDRTAPNIAARRHC